MNNSEFDRKYIWHPFTQEGSAPLNITLTKADGIYVYDENNNKYMDLVSSWWTVAHGHCNKRIADAIAEQAHKFDHIIFAGFTHEPAIKLVEKLRKFMNNDFDKFFFSDNGSTAIEIALKMTYQYWKNKGDNNRKIFLTMKGNYHGDTFGAMSVGKTSDFYKPFEDLFFKVEYLPTPATWIDDKNVEEKENEALEYTKKFLDENASSVASFLLESILQGASGMNMVRPIFVEKLCKLIKSYNIPVIFDEVMTGFYRTGTKFAYEQTNFVPDIICLSKALTGGFLPMAITATTQEIYDVFYSEDIEKAFLHGHSYTANPLTCIAALTSIELFEENNVFEKVEKITEIHKEEIIKLVRKYPFIEKPRVCGLIGAFDIKVEKSGYSSNIAKTLKEVFLKEGLIIRPLGNVFYLFPSYIITEEELKGVYIKIDKIISNLKICD